MALRYCKFTMLTVHDRNCPLYHSDQCNHQSDPMCLINRDKYGTDDLRAYIDSARVAGDHEALRRLGYE